MQTIVNAGPPPIRFGPLRHTAGTMLVARGVHRKVVGQILGHATIILALGTSSHLVPSMHG